MNKYVIGLIATFMLIIFIGCATTYNRSHHLELLRSYYEYEYEPIENLPEFTYMDSSDGNLVKLRETFKLEEVAGYGDEMSRIINLMKWVHNIVRHSGRSMNPSPRNTFNIIKVCQKKNRGVNCRMMATILNEVYLAMGFKSRFITCMPEKKNFKDCHVINMVYSTTLDKWIYMDPTFESYFTDENGNHLSIQEVRENFMRDKPVIVNDEINWNGEKLDKEKYISYMSKNLFRFKCSISSKFNCESTKEINYIELIPKGYISRKGLITKLKPALLALYGYKIVKYYTSNPEFFWERPIYIPVSN